MFLLLNSYIILDCHRHFMSCCHSLDSRRLGTGDSKNDLFFTQGNKKESGTSINCEPTMLRDRRGKLLSSIVSLATETS